MMCKMLRLMVFLALISVTVAIAVVITSIVAVIVMGGCVKDDGNNGDGDATAGGCGGSGSDGGDGGNRICGYHSDGDDNSGDYQKFHL